MKSCLFCHIHTLQYCGNCLLLGQSLLGIVLRGKAQLGVEQALCFKIADEIKCGKRERLFSLKQTGRQLKACLLYTSDAADEL